tara:strand:+ start:460 stop:675 length:216 start_codon:yes stop_codon:yes gene_type:complete
MNKIIFTAILIFLIPSTSYAYLDPGTGSIILQAIIGAIAAGLMTIKIWWQKFKILLSKFLNLLKTKDKSNQ